MHRGDGAGTRRAADAAVSATGRRPNGVVASGITATREREQSSWPASPTLPAGDPAGDIGQGAAPTTGTVDLAALLRQRAR